MSLNNFQLLPTTVYGEPAGNYDGSSLDFHGDSVIAADYYSGNGSIQTVTISVADFVGRVEIEATLNDNAATAAWFRTDTFGDGLTPVTEVHPITILGNFVYMRVRVTDFTAGTINSITLAY